MVSFAGVLLAELLAPRPRDTTGASVKAFVSSVVVPEMRVARKRPRDE